MGTVQRTLVIAVVVLFAGTVIGSAASADDLTVLTPQAGFEAPGEMMTRYLNGLGMAALDQRAARLAEVKTPEQVKVWQQKTREFFLDQLGPWPERTPLKAQVVGRQEFDDYRLEKVLFESRPGFHVTGILYLPKSKPPYPAVLVPCGHADEAKAYPVYQQASVLMARCGMAAFCFDPIGQGERRQILDAQGKPMLGSTTEHTQVGTGCILLGINAASHLIWDGMRAIDYLVSRDDIDAGRIGCTGQSGGGTQTSYLMALDDRIVSAAPSCFITSIRRLWETIAPQDAEQNIHGAVLFGMEHADYLIARAPKPTMVLSATKDFFDIGGTRSTFQEARRIYGILGAADRLAITESESEHSFNPVLRAASAGWMRRWLLDRDEPVTEPECAVLKPEDLYCSPRGQVLKLPDEKSVFDLNVELADRLARERQANWEGASNYKVLGRVCKLAGIRLLEKLPEPEVAGVGIVERQGCRIEKLVLKVEPGIVLPALAFEPAKADDQAYLYLHGEGKAVDAGAGGPIEKLLEAGHRVLAVDLRGIGETRPKPATKGFDEWFGPLWKDFFRAYLLGRSFVGMRAEDTLVSGRFLADYRSGAFPNRVHLIAIGEAAVPALHAAATHPKLFASVKIDRCLVSWEDVVKTPLCRNQLINVVHGALAVYDLPDLMASLPDDRFTMGSLVDAAGQEINFDDLPDTQSAPAQSP
ncbi:MAG TPA: acetylxylan esterase [Phycisphaerae bacterium]|nr:acetylxylan esterase [Phycisphaerae bacterium]